MRNLNKKNSALKVGQARSIRKIRDLTIGLYSSILASRKYRVHLARQVAKAKAEAKKRETALVTWRDYWPVVLDFQCLIVRH